MDIILVPIGRVHEMVMGLFKGDLNSVFSRTISIGQGMPEPDYAFNPERNQYLSRAILGAISEEKEHKAF